jgi:hypothetical protein
MRRLLLPLLATISFSLPAVAQDKERGEGAQKPVLKITGDYRGLTPEDRAAYCFWAGQIYSIGASFCFRQNSEMVCTAIAGNRPQWTTRDNEKLCDRNPSLTPQ